MKKLFLLSLLFATPITHGMEKEKKEEKGIFSKLGDMLHVASDIVLGEQSSEEEHFVANDNDPMEKERLKLEKALYEHKNWAWNKEDGLKYLVIFRYPEHVYGYVENNGAGKEYDKALIDYNSETVAEMKHVINARYDGYSGIGALMLAVGERHTKKRDAKEIMRKLHYAGMEPTDNDKKMAAYLKQSKLLNRS